MKEIQQLRRIAVKLGVSGTTVPIAETRLYKGGYGFVVLQCYVPITQNRSPTTNPLCTVFRSTVDRFGNRKQFNKDIYNMLYTTDTEIENVKHMVFECLLPSAFTDTVGELEMIFTYSEVNAENKAVSRLASGIYRTNIADSDVSDGATVDPVGGELARLNDFTIKVEQLEDSVDALLQPPDCTDANKVGTPNVELTVDGRLKFSELKGEKGNTAELAIGTVETVDYTEKAEVTNSGTTTDAILDFKIPQGKPAFVKIGKVITLPPESEARVVNVGTDNDPIFDFYIPEGKGFVIDITYPSIEAMNAGFSTDGVRLYGFAIIDTGNVEDEDNAKLYIKTKTKYRYLTDMSGAQGIQGKAATIEIDYNVEVLDPEEPPAVENIGTENAALLKFKLPKGATVDVAESVVQLDENEEPRVENIGNEHRALLKFYLPRGRTGNPGEPANIDELKGIFYWTDNPPPVATADESGTAKLGSDTVQSAFANPVTQEIGRTYRVQLDENGRLVVNVPWTDNDTTYTFTNKNITLSWGTKSTIATVGGVDITVTMPENPNTDTTYSAGTGITLSSGNAFSVKYGTAADTACEGNDSRLSDARNTKNTLTFNNGGSGAASGTTFNGSAAKTISYNTIGAVPTSRTVNGQALSADVTITKTYKTTTRYSSGSGSLSFTAGTTYNLSQAFMGSSVPEEWVGGVFVYSNIKGLIISTTQFIALNTVSGQTISSGNTYTIYYTTVE